MNKTQLRLAAVTIVMLATVPFTALGQGAAVGTLAPSFSLLDQQSGELQSLDQYLGEVLVLFIIGYG
jgi:hypothetical protein